MKVTWIGHACFRIEKDGYSVILDPYKDGVVPGLKPVRVQANEVLCSHEHGDHSARECVEIIASEEKPFQVSKLESYHDESKGTKRGPNTIHIFTDGKVRVAHMGDQGCMPDADQLEELKNLDLMMLPVGGHYTVDAKEAAEIIAAVQPKVVIPMHYRDKDGKFGYPVIAPVECFTDIMDKVEFKDASDYEVGAGDSTIVVLKPLNLE